MARAGDVIENTLTGDRVHFLQTARDTGGALLQFEETLKPRGYGPPPHIHPLQQERFKVISGCMGVMLDGQVHLLNPGESIAVPPGHRHNWWNAGDTEMVHISEFRPARHFETYMETLFALGRAGKTFKYGQIPYLLQFALLSDTYKETVYLTPLPIPVQKVLYRLLAPVARRLGYNIVNPW